MNKKFGLTHQKLDPPLSNKYLHKNHHIHRSAFALEQIARGRLGQEFIVSQSRKIVSNAVAPLTGEECSGLSCSNECLTDFSRDRGLFCLDTVRHDINQRMLGLTDEETPSGLLPASRVVLTEFVENGFEYIELEVDKEVSVQLQVQYCFNRLVPNHKNAVDSADLDDNFRVLWDEQLEVGQHASIRLKKPIEREIDNAQQFTFSSDFSSVQFTPACFNLTSWVPCNKKLVEFIPAAMVWIKNDQDFKNIEKKEKLFMTTSRTMFRFFCVIYDKAGRNGMFGACAVLNKAFDCYFNTGFTQDFSLSLLDDTVNELFACGFADNGDYKDIVRVAFKAAIRPPPGKGTVCDVMADYYKMGKGGNVVKFRMPVVVDQAQPSSKTTPSQKATSIFLNLAVPEEGLVDLAIVCDNMTDTRYFEAPDQFALHEEKVTPIDVPPMVEMYSCAVNPVSLAGLEAFESGVKGMQGVLKTLSELSSDVVVASKRVDQSAEAGSLRVLIRNAPAATASELEELLNTNRGACELFLRAVSSNGNVCVTSVIGAQRIVIGTLRQDYKIHISVFASERSEILHTVTSRCNAISKSIILFKKLAFPAFHVRAYFTGLSTSFGVQLDKVYPGDRDGAVEVRAKIAQSLKSHFGLEEKLVFNTRSGTYDVRLQLPVGTSSNTFYVLICQDANLQELGRKVFMDYMQKLGQPVSPYRNDTSVEHLGMQYDSI